MVDTPWKPANEHRRRRFSAMPEAVPRLDRSRPGVQLDTGLPVVLLWVSEFPLQHGCLGVFRTLGRAGVPVYPVIADARSPICRSRYVAGHILWRPQCGDTAGELIERLIALSGRFERRPLIVCMTDEVALLVAKHSGVLREHFTIPDVAPDLPGQLADKVMLNELCKREGFVSPRSWHVDSALELEAVIDQIEPPVVAKSTTLRFSTVAQNVLGSIVIDSRATLQDLAGNWVEPFRILLQEYIPDEVSEDWLVNGYCGADAEAKVIFTGKKDRLWPPQGGSLAAGYTVANPELVALTTSLCREVGYQGIFDCDWRLDRRTGKYYMLDFNPRVGAQFRMFESDAGIDVVRAMHLDLSGRVIPAGSEVEGERFVVEAWDAAGIIATRRPARWTGGSGRPRLAWAAADDPLPVLAMVAKQAAMSVRARLPH